LLAHAQKLVMTKDSAQPYNGQAQRAMYDGFANGAGPIDRKPEYRQEAFSAAMAQPPKQVTFSQNSFDPRGTGNFGAQSMPPNFGASAHAFSAGTNSAPPNYPGAPSTFVSSNIGPNLSHA